MEDSSEWVIDKITKIVGGKRMEIDEKEEERIEAEASKFVKGIFLNAKETFKSGTYKKLDFSGYTKNGRLVHYEDVEKFLDGLNPEKLKEFFRAFLNHTYQAAYHVSEAVIDDFLEFSKKSREGKLHSKIEREIDIDRIS